MPPAGPADTFWRSLNYFNLYRMVVACVFVSAVFIQGETLSFGSQNPVLFTWVSAIYLVLAVLFYAALLRIPKRFNLHLTLQVSTDILALTLLMYASGGAKSGLAFMLLIVLAGAGLVGRGRLTLFYAALATIAVQFEQGYRVLTLGADPGDFFQAGITCIGFFATAITAHLLARRVVTNETLARRRGIELDDQLSINQRVIRDMQDGVLVVDGDGQVRQRNPQAEVLLGVRAPAASDLRNYSRALAELYPSWRRHSVEAMDTVLATGSGKMLRARFLPAGEGGNALIYLEDLDRIQAQAQQMKLAALGRLTANMAHEIRNPLSAISHAAELLAEERRSEMQARLISIIGDNSQRINRLIIEVLELGRRDRAQLEALHLFDFIEAFLDEYVVQDSQVLQKVVMDVDENAVLSFGHAHLNRVLWNLLCNALRHSSGKPGSIRLVARAAAPPERAELHVIDDGPGIETSLRSQVFEPFFTTHSSGTGLGLYIARELCEANGAMLEILENAPGAHFRITGRGDHVRKP